MGKISHRAGDEKPTALDEELERVASAQPESSARAAPLPAKTAPRARRSSFGMLSALLVMAAGIVALFLFGFKDAAVYSVPVDQLLTDRASVGRRVRIDGELVPGSLVKRDKPCEYRFRIRANGKELDVHYPQCAVPDTFRDVPQGGVLVTAEGKLSSAGTFDASLILAKCASKYDPATHTMHKAGPADRM